MTDGGLGIFNTNICSGPVKNMRGRHKNMTDSYICPFFGADPVKNMTIRHKNTPDPSYFFLFLRPSPVFCWCVGVKQWRTRVFLIRKRYFFLARVPRQRVVLHSFSLPFALSPSVALIFFFRARQPTPALLGLGSLVLGIECWVLELGSWVFAWSCVFDLWSWVLGVLSCHLA